LQYIILGIKNGRYEEAIDLAKECIDQLDAKENDEKMRGMDKKETTMSFESEHDTQVREHGYRDGWKDGYDAGYKAAWTEVDKQEAVEDSERRDLFEKITNVCIEADNQEILAQRKNEAH